MTDLAFQLISYLNIGEMDASARSQEVQGSERSNTLRYYIHILIDDNEDFIALNCGVCQNKVGRRLPSYMSTFQVAVTTWNFTKYSEIL